MKKDQQDLHRRQIAELAAEETCMPYNIEKDTD